MNRTLFASLLGLGALSAVGFARASASQRAWTVTAGESRTLAPVVVVTQPDGTRLVAPCIALSCDPQATITAQKGTYVANSPSWVYVPQSTPDATQGHAQPEDRFDVEHVETSDPRTGAWRVEVERHLAQARSELEAGRDRWREALKLQVEKARLAPKLPDGAFEEALELQLGTEEPSAQGERRRVFVERRAASESPSRADRPRVLRLRTTSESDAATRLRERVEALERAARERGWESRGGDRSIEERVTELERLMESGSPSPGVRRTAEVPGRTQASERGRVRVLTPGEDGRGLTELDHERNITELDHERSITELEHEPGSTELEQDREIQQLEHKLLELRHPRIVRTPQALVAPRAPAAPRAPQTPSTRVFRAQSPFAENELASPPRIEPRDRAEIERLLQELRGEADRLRAELQRMRNEIDRLPAGGTR